MDRRVLYELEKEFEKTLDWNREEVKKRSTPIIAQGYFPPEEYVIQGLMPAPKSNAPKRRGCRGCEFYHRVKKCLIKARIGLVMKGYCPKKYMKAKPAAAVREKIIYDEGRRVFYGVKMRITPVCGACDFFNKIDKYCALQAIGRECRFNIKMPRKEAYRREAAPAPSRVEKPIKPKAAR